ncbi:hypothetical protein [Salinispira pacifica]
MSAERGGGMPQGMLVPVELGGREIMSLYLYLRREESSLDGPLLSLLNRLEELMFSRFSIDQMERIAELYDGGVDLFSTDDGASRS